MTALLLASGPGAAQSDLCDPSLPSPKDDSYAYRLRGDRCEGRYVKEVGGTTLLIGSFTAALESIDGARGAARQISWPHVPGASEVRVRAQSIKRRLYYRLDTRKAADAGSFAWPSNVLAVVAPGRDDVGVIAWTRLRVGAVERDVLLPVRVTYDRVASPLPRYQLIVVPSVQLEELSVTVSELAEDGRLRRVLRKSEPLLLGYYPAERGIEILLPLAALGSAGLYRVNLLARLAGGGSATDEVWFFHPGP